MTEPTEPTKEQIQADFAMKVNAALVAALHNVENLAGVYLVQFSRSTEGGISTESVCAFGAVSKMELATASLVLLEDTEAMVVNLAGYLHG